jgi:molecular chaperone HscB
MSSSPAPTATTPDAFALLGLPPRFDLDPATIEAAFFEHSRAFHADRFATAPAAERVVALSRSRALNDAYQILKRPVRRAEYLLGCHGVTIGANERLPGGFLMEILELREELAAARHAGWVDEVERLSTAMTARRQSTLAALAPGFAALERADADRPAVLADLKAQLIGLRYLDRYLEECAIALDPDADVPAARA